jgi:spore coat protein U-like protein
LIGEHALLPRRERSYDGVSVSPLRATFAALVLATVALPGIGRAQTCSFTGSSTPVAFGTYTPTSATPNDSTGSFTYSCTSAKARPVVVQLSAGNAGSFNPRQMALGADRLNYNLYTTALRDVVFGDGTGGTATVNSVPTGSMHGATVTIYGRVPAGQWVTAGAYADTVTITISF